MAIDAVSVRRQLIDLASVLREERGAMAGSLDVMTLDNMHSLSRILSITLISVCRMTKDHNSLAIFRQRKWGWKRFSNRKVSSSIQASLQDEAIMRNVFREYEIEENMGCHVTPERGSEAQKSAICKLIEE